MYKFHYEYVKNKFNATLLFTNPDSLSMKSKEKIFRKNFLKTENCLILVIIQ